MAGSRPSRSDREREARETAARNRGASIRLGIAGVALLFLGAIATLFFPSSALLLLLAMVAGLALIFVAFLMIRSATGSSLRLRDLTKML